MDNWSHWNRIVNRIYASVVFGKFPNKRQLFIDLLFSKMCDVQMATSGKKIWRYVIYFFK